MEVAYLLGSRWGWAGRRLLAIRDYAFWTLGLTRLVCLISDGNAASVKVAEKMGMTFERDGEDEYGPFHLYSMSRPETAAA
ncbi:MAG: GNAT family N-acetyltransferase [Caldilineae bacterium]|nr:GNAT family N-acetyltransferase [Caldilineae bacterium]